jgi:tetratricopeptide (TPR) repeat protein
METVQIVGFDVDRFLHGINTLPDHRTREYEVGLTELAKKLSAHDFQELRDWLSAQYVVVRTENDTQFGVFIVLCTYSRRKKNTYVFKDIVEESDGRFVGYPLYPHILSLLYKEMSEVERSIQSAKEASINLPNQIGVLHNYAEAIVQAKENSLYITDEQMNEALELINKVTGRRDPSNAKFHCTRGRILAQYGQFAEAKRSILKAIDLEDSSNSDYSIRINDYQYHLVRVQTIEFNRSFEGKLSEFNRSLEGKLSTTEQSLAEQKKDIDKSLHSIKAENLQMLGFFVAIISFTMGSLNILQGKKFLESGLLILILMGSTVLAYIGFGLLINIQVRKKAMIIVSILALLVVIGAFSSYYLLG